MHDSSRRTERTDPATALGWTTPIVASLTLAMTAIAAAAPTDPPPAATHQPGTSAPPTAASPTAAPATGEPAFNAVDPEKARAEKERALQRRFLPDALTDAELDDLESRLGFNDEAKRLFAVTRERYREASRNARDQKGREVLRLLPAAFKYDAHEAEFQPVYTPELLSVLRIGEAVGSSIGDAERALEHDLGQLCDGPHRATWRRLRAARCDALFGEPTRLPGARVNLLELLPKAGLAEGELTSLDLIIDRYTDDYVSAVKERHDALRANEMRRGETFVALGPEWRAGRTIDEAIQVEREIAQFDTAEVRSDIALRDLNAATVEKIRKTLPPQPARRVLVAWQSVVHPELFEDERLLRGVMEQFLALEGILPDVRSVAIDHLVAVEEQLWPQGQQAVELADNLVVAQRLPPTDAAQVRIALDAQLHKILTKRRKLVREAVRELVGTVPAEQAAFVDKLNDTLATFDAQDRASRFLMDQLASRERELQTLLAMGETPATAAQDVPANGRATPTTVPVGAPDGADPKAGDEGGAGGTSESQQTTPPPPGAGDRHDQNVPNDPRDHRDHRGTRRNGQRRP